MVDCDHPPAARPTGPFAFQVSSFKCSESRIRIREIKRSDRIKNDMMMLILTNLLCNPGTVR